MLSYLLENKEVQGVKTVERFREKFSEDPATFMLIDRATKGQTDTILFNIDIEGSINKDKTAVLRVFAKMFYNYLGFYGENLKVAKLEQFIAKKGKTEEFRRVFEEKNGASWLESRDAYAFFEDDIVATLQEVLGMSEQAASNWFNGTETVETSIAQLVSEIKEYVDAQPRDFRLLFMIDEVGQYVGGDTDSWRRSAASAAARSGWSAPGRKPSTRSSRPARTSSPAFKPASRPACPCLPLLQMRLSRSVSF